MHALSPCEVFIESICNLIQNPFGILCYRAFRNLRKPHKFQKTQKSENDESSGCGLTIEICSNEITQQRYPWLCLASKNVVSRPILQKKFYQIQFTVTFMLPMSFINELRHVSITYFSSQTIYSFCSNRFQETISSHS